jgi:hypothetical protein
MRWYSSNAIIVAALIGGVALLKTLSDNTPGVKIRITLDSPTFELMKKSSNGLAY